MKEATYILSRTQCAEAVVGVRNVTAGNEAVADIIRENPDACVECCALDLASFSSVRTFARSAVGNQPVSAIVHNAGVLTPPFQTTMDGHELTFQVNHLAPFLLTNLLLSNLRRAHQATGELSRVIMVSSGAHRWASIRGKGAAGGLASGAGAVSRGADAEQRGWTFRSWKAYAGSKLCNVLYAAELTKRYGGDDSGVIGLAVRPGTVATSIARHSFFLRMIFRIAHPFLTPVEKAGEAVALAVVNPAVSPGGYYILKELGTPSAAAQDVALQESLWEVTTNILLSGGDLQRAVDIS